MSYRYAKRTSVPVDQSRNEVEKILRGQGGVKFFNVDLDEHHILGCQIKDRFLRFKVPYPKGRDQAIRDRELRRRWRCLVLSVKAKFATIDAGIASLEEEFLANVMTPDQKTVYDHIQARIKEMYESGKVSPRLLGQWVDSKAESTYEAPRKP